MTQKTNTIISALALFASAISSLYAYRQYTSTETQLSLYKNELTIIENNLKATQEQVELQKISINRDNEFSIVADEQFIDSLNEQVTNGKEFEIIFHNISKYAYRYRVAVKSNAMFLGWDINSAQQTPTRAIYIDTGNIIVPPNGKYTGKFIVLHPNVPYPKATIAIYVNDKMIIGKIYKYDKNTNTYVFEENMASTN